MSNSDLSLQQRTKAITKAVRSARWRITWKRRWQTDIYDGHSKNYLFSVHNAEGYYLLSLSRRRRRIEYVDTNGNHTEVVVPLLSDELLFLVQNVLQELPR